MCSNKFRPIILAGGSGKRLWPLSTKEKPKQFISLFGDFSLFDLTLQRINNRDLFKKPIIVTAEDYLSLVEESLSKTGVEVESVFLEPESKNTFSALALPVLAAMKKHEEEKYMAMPSDHYIPFNKAFYETCTRVKNQFKKEGLTLLGVLPDNPSTEYGYISINSSNEELKPVKSFIEKPGLEEAKKLMKQPDTLWNAGIFCFEGRWMDEIIKSSLNLSGSETLVDAYSGVGTFAISLASSVGKVIAIEESASAINDAEFAIGDIDNIEFILGKTENMLSSISDDIDILILDPSRKGCHPDTIEVVLEKSPKKIVYVSCDPVTLARDLNMLLSEGYSITYVQPLDMFPQTYHVEVIVIMDR